jgi:hypothetical protein
MNDGVSHKVDDGWIMIERELVNLFVYMYVTESVEQFHTLDLFCSAHLSTTSIVHTMKVLDSSSA